MWGGPEWASRERHSVAARREMSMLWGLLAQANPKAQEPLNGSAAGRGATVAGECSAKKQRRAAPLAEKADLTEQVD